MRFKEVAVMVGRFCLLPLAVTYVSVHFMLERLMTWVLLAGAACDRVIGLNRTLSRHPLAWLLVTSVLTAALGSGIIDIPMREPYLRWPAYTAVWTLLMYVLIIAHFHSSSLPAPDAMHDGIRQRWLERRLSSYLQLPLNAVFLRPMLANSVLIFPLAAAVIVPPLASWFAGLSYVAMLAIGSLAHETLDHTDIHNHLFRARKGASGWSSLVPRMMNRYLRGVLNPLFCRMPAYYRVQHIYIHHVENNGLDDVQSTVKHDRTSFFDFCIFALKCGASFSFAHDVISYLRRKGKRRPVRQLLTGAAYWVLLLAAIAVHNPGAALLLFCARFFFGTAIALNAYVWHGLADPGDPGNVFLNSINVRTSASGSPGALHMRHHQYMGEHWSVQCVASQEELDAAAKEGALTLNAISPNLFLKALWARRFDLIAQAVVKPEQAAISAETDMNALCTVINERTGSAIALRRSRTRLRLDSACGRMFSRYIVPGGKLPPAA